MWQRTDTAEATLNVTGVNGTKHPLMPITQSKDKNSWLII
jgi:hypothetical protein